MVLHKRCNNTASFAEHIKLKKNVTFTYALWVNNDKSK